MKFPLRRFTALAVFAVVLSLAPRAHADEHAGALRALWTSLRTWFAPPAGGTPARRLESAVREEGVTIDPFGRSSATPPPAAPSGGTTEPPVDPSG